MLLAADGELSTRRAAQVHSHLADCWACRARMAEIEETIADFARAHRQTLDPQLPPIAGPRALLRAQLAELAEPNPSFLAAVLPVHFGHARCGVFVCACSHCRCGWQDSRPPFHAACEQTQSLIAFERGAFPTATLRQARRGELRSATFARWLTRKSSERYQRRCVRRSFGSMES